MKKRLGFVSNSSSSSFVINEVDLETATKKITEFFDVLIHPSKRDSYEEELADTKIVYVKDLTEDDKQYLDSFILSTGNILIVTPQNTPYIITEAIEEYYNNGY